MARTERASLFTSRNADINRGCAGPQRSVVAHSEPRPGLRCRASLAAHECHKQRCFCAETSLRGEPNFARRALDDLSCSTNLDRVPAAYDSNHKRRELVRAAKALLHEQGFHRSSLADVAARASIPLGNVHYYFKTKESLAEAVIASHEAALLELFGGWSRKFDEPQKRLRALVRAPLDGAEGILRFGCPHGSLCQELEKLGADAPLAKAGVRLLAVYLDWAEAQFREVGFRNREPRALAEQLVSSIQGTLLISHTMRSKTLLAQQLRRIEHWLDETTSQSS